MPPLIDVVGLDPSMRNWGIAVGSLDLDSLKVTIKELIVNSPSEPTSQTIKQNVKDIHVAQRHYSALYPILKASGISFVEIPIGSKSAAAMKGYGLCIGVLGSLKDTNTPLYRVSPNQVKSVTGNSKASKKEMISWAMNEHPEAPWPMKKIKGIESPIEGVAEHMADAIAAIHAGIRLPEFKLKLPSYKQRYKVNE